MMILVCCVFSHHAALIVLAMKTEGHLPLDTRTNQPLHLNHVIVLADIVVFVAQLTGLVLNHIFCLSVNIYQKKTNNDFLKSDTLR